MWRFGFFDAVETDPGVYDRVYNAEEFSVPFSALIDTGVLEGAGDSLEVTTDGSSMQTTISTGVAFIRGRYAENTSPRAHTHDTETVGVDRIDRIVVRLDLRPEARHVESFVKKGVASTNPAPPALQRDENVYEISLAQVYIRGGQSFIDPADITDERGDEDVCPWARSKVLPHIDAQDVIDLRNEFNEHKGDEVTLPGGVHGIRVVNGQLEYWDKNDQEWKRIAGSIEDPREAKIYGLEWNQTLDTYQRLDDAVGMIAITQGQNDFSSVYPWSEMKRCNLADDGTVTAYYGDPTYKDDGSNGQVMVQIPKFWYKSEMINENDNKIYRWWIADNPVDGFKLHPAFSRNGVEKDYIYIGAYEGYISEEMLHSRAGVMPTAGRTIVSYRNFAQARGSIWHQQDFLTICAIQLLYLIEYAHFDSQTKIGRGITNDSNQHQTGETAQYGNESYGTTSNETTAMSYRGIENLYGNFWQWVDGININNHQAYIADSNFVSDKFDDHYRQVGFTNATSNGFVKDIGWTEDDDYMFLPIDATGSATSYLHDYYWQSAGVRVAIFGGSRDFKDRAGAFCWDMDFAKSSEASLGVCARLLCIP